MKKVNFKATDLQQPADCRCHCGKLIAKLTLKGIEVQCARCKHVHVFPVALHSL